MTDTPNIKLNLDFDYQNIIVDNVKCGDSYTKISIDKIDDIFVSGEDEEMGLHEKFDRLSHFSGHIHLIVGASFSIEDSKIKSIRLRDAYLQGINLKTRKAIELELGIADKELTDGIMWVWDYVVDAKVLVYNKLKLHVLVDPTHETLKEIRFGDLDEREYD
jgi:hypothetical protein